MKCEICGGNLVHDSIVRDLICELCGAEHNENGKILD